PLWGVADSAPYLHDGRAKTLHEAVLWHGGEAFESVNKYKSLRESERESLLTFMRSLRAPNMPAEIAAKKTPSDLPVDVKRRIGVPVPVDEQQNASKIDAVTDVFANGY
ncbi:MAG: di-heme oxidoredictase family protein, partial [Pirellulaceae bacterium]